MRGSVVLGTYQRYFTKFPLLENAIFSGLSPFFLPGSLDRAVGNLFLARGVRGIIQNPGVSPRTCLHFT